MDVWYDLLTLITIIKKGRKCVRIISNIKQNKIEVIEILLLAVGLSTGINLISTYMGIVLDVRIIARIGIVIIVISILYILFLKRPDTSNTIETSAVLSVSAKTNELLEVEGYNYNNDFMNCLSSLFRENKLLKEQWTKDPIGHYDYYGKKISDDAFKDSRNRKLIKEITEYVYLEHLSMHLSAYFENSSYNKKFLTSLSRDDSSEIIMSNRVVDLFTKKLEDRIKTRKKDRVMEILKEDDNELPELHYKTVNGIIYRKFELILPKNSKISRNVNGGIDISNDSISVSFNVIQQGTNSFVDRLFEKYYMGNKLAFEMFGMQHYNVDIITRIKIKPSLIAFGKRSEYHKWADSFIEKIDNKMSFAKFIKRINWQTAKTFHIMQRNAKKLKV